MESRGFCVLTGGSKGIGYATAKKLCEKGFEVLLTSRKLDCARDAATKIKKELGDNVSVWGEQLDLSSFKSIEEFVETLGDREIDVLFNNAGLMPNSVPERVVTEDGFELMMQTNVFGLMKLTQLLLPKLAKDGVIIIQGSKLHMGGGKGPEINWDWENLNCEKEWNAMLQYKHSKLALMWYSYHLSTLVPQKVIVTSPGFVPESIAETYSGARYFFFAYVLHYMPFASTVTQAAENGVFAACEYNGEGKKFISEKKVIDASKLAEDEKMQREFYERAIEMIKK